MRSKLRKPHRYCCTFAQIAARRFPATSLSLVHTFALCGYVCDVRSLQLEKNRHVTKEWPTAAANVTRVSANRRNVNQALRVYIET